ncbi:diguanylate cyclase [uncultured Pseudodesulfovibrio sp.]|uniref:GGDEF domain-containing protein n=1 Tax=uncultured Pseudodesulfovibrio sp. TaxID=2035858 RepID=UPI0029C92822|nr:diguanylate cyclase [uncultured Pseudodesulfovibrio sp.]
MHIQSKLTAGYITIGVVSCLLAVFIARDIIRDNFSDYVRQEEFSQFQADLKAYISRYGGLDRAMHMAPFSSFVAPNDATRRWQGQPFRFLLLDEAGAVLYPAYGYKAGETVSSEVMAEASPVTVDGKVVALVAHTEVPAMTAEDEAFLRMVDISLAIGTSCAAVLSILLGCVFAWRQSAPAKMMIRSVRTLCDGGSEGTCIEMPADEDLGELVEIYNNMSKELSRRRFELDELAVLDPQTNLYNRRHFDEQVRLFFESAKRYEQPLSLVMGDLDRFRTLNETFSREVGDMVLEKVAQLISEHTRKSDVIARYGGEEFVILFTHTARDKAAIACENIRRTIEEYPWEEFHADLKVTISMGLADNADMDSAASMIARADQYLSAAKAGGRNQVAGAE